MGPVILFGLGLVLGALLYRPERGFVARSLLAAAAATALWLAGTYTVFAASATSELGPPLPGPLLFSFLTALAGAALAGVFLGLRESLAD